MLAIILRVLNYDRTRPKPIRRPGRSPAGNRGRLAVFPRSSLVGLAARTLEAGMSDKEMSALDAWIACALFGWQAEIRKRYGACDNVEGYGKNVHLSLGDPNRDFTS